MFWTLAAIALSLQWVAFIPAYLQRTERFYDLVGSATFLTLTALAVWWATAPLDTRSLVLAAVVIVWSLRLGTYLVRRIHRAGRDDRFDAIKQSFGRFLLAWTMQGMWVVITASPALLAILSADRVAPDLFLALGLVLWLGGFAIEVVADAQKARFAADPANRGRFITTGLWSRSRHPNYFGEIVLWLGTSAMAWPVLRGWEHLSLLSPVFVAWLLIRVSGIPMLERKAEARWGADPAYLAWRSRTPRLVPRTRG
jgi:steroid 5-alpha reductase family enzyme